MTSLLDLTWVKTGHFSSYTIFDPINPCAWVLKSSDLYLKVTFWPWFGFIIWGVFGMMIIEKFLQPPKIWLLRVLLHLLAQKCFIPNANLNCIFKINHDSHAALIQCCTISREKWERKKFSLCEWDALCTAWKRNNSTWIQFFLSHFSLEKVKHRVSRDEQEWKKVQYFYND